MLLDTPSLYFRAFFGVPESVTGRRRHAGERGARAARHDRPARTRPVAALGWSPAWTPTGGRVPGRRDARRTRRTGSAQDGGDQIPDTLSPQVPVIVEVLEAFGIASVGAPGYEADDVIGTLATVADGEVDIVTGDRDLFQLVGDDQPVRVLYTARGIKALQVIGRGRGRREVRHPRPGYADFATLRGDPSDGLPGVPGRRREDRRRTDHAVRLAGGDRARPRRRRDGRLPGRKPAEAGEGPGLPRRGRDGRPGRHATSRCPDFDARLPRTPSTRSASSS